MRYVFGFLILLVFLSMTGFASAIDSNWSMKSNGVVINENFGSTSAIYGEAVKIGNVPVWISGFNKTGDDQSTRGILEDSSGGTILTCTFSGNYCQFSTPYKLKSTFYYWIVADGDGSSVNRYRNNTGAGTLYPIQSDYFIWNGTIANNVRGIGDFYTVQALNVSNINPNLIDYEFIYNSSTYEIALESYTLNITVNSTFSPDSATFIYAGTSYSTTKTTDANQTYFTSSSVKIPLGIATRNATFQIAYGTDYYNVTTQQSVSAINLSICNPTINVPYLNITFKDETTLTYINATIPSATFTYWLGSASTNKTLSLINNTENPSYAFCFSPSGRTINILPYIQYASTGYPQRTYNPSILSFNNLTTNKVLYLLSSSSGLYVTFQVLGASGTPLQGVEVTANRTISGSPVTVGFGETDSAGAITFWLNPDFEHTFSFVKTGYDSYTTSLTPTQSQYTINLGTSTITSNDTQYSRDIRELIKPTGDFLYKNLNYSFNYTISTSYWTLDGWGFTLKYGNGTIIGTQSSSVDVGGTLNINANTSTQNKIVMQYFYVVNGTYVNGTRYWLTQSPNDFSITHFFTDLATYIDADMFGILGDDNGQFSKALIAVLILVGVTGIFGYRYGIQSEATILGIIFGIVLFLNTLNLIPNPSFLTESSVSLGDLISFIVLLITIGMVIKEESQ